MIIVAYKSDSEYDVISKRLPIPKLTVRNIILKFKLVKTVENKL